MSASDPAVNARWVLSHAAVALARYAKERRTDGVEVPGELDALAELLLNAVRPRPDATRVPLADDAAEAGVMFKSPLTTKAEAARALRRSVRTVERLIASGDLLAVQVMGATLIRRSDLDSYVAGLTPTTFRDKVGRKDGAA